ncbi:hypothetical protein E2C01_087049 [Portunus trituberculatus]|uniref:Uncharacterized protein n=1 Tax=Portunus trituberculatus TaxID=210409 RepID=A0A5B7J744_PORTR|nr:hypothetical protein [Portunus trituberculatus]
MPTLSVCLSGGGDGMGGMAVYSWRVLAVGGSWSRRKTLAAVNAGGGSGGGGGGGASVQLLSA